MRRTDRVHQGSDDLSPQILGDLCKIYEYYHIILVIAYPEAAHPVCHRMFDPQGDDFTRRAQVERREAADLVRPADRGILKQSGKQSYSFPGIFSQITDRYFEGLRTDSGDISVSDLIHGFRDRYDHVGPHHVPP